MLSLSFCAGMLGIEGYVVRVEADSSAGSPIFTIIGLPDRALKIVKFTRSGSPQPNFPNNSDSRAEQFGIREGLINAGAFSARNTR
jgi:hypothetical protein